MTDNQKKILSSVDHTLLSIGASEEEIRILCEDAIRYGTASVCIPPNRVAEARRFCGDRMRVCTVIGFPNGYSSAAVKAAEAREALRDGADEIDMVICNGWVKDGRFDRILDEIQLVREACRNAVLKVIVETCLLTGEEKIRMCEVVTASGADYIKTSTGFAGGGAVPADVALFAAHVGAGVKIKAAGGIASFEDAEEFLRLGASRLGTSRLVKLLKAEEG